MRNADGKVLKYWPKNTHKIRAFTLLQRHLGSGGSSLCCVFGLKYRMSKVYFVKNRGCLKGTNTHPNDHRGQKLSN